MVKIIIIDDDDNEVNSEPQTPAQEVGNFLLMCLGAAIFYPILVGAVYFVINPVIALFRDNWPVDEVYRMINWTESFVLFGFAAAVYALMTLPDKEAISDHKIWLLPIVAIAIIGYPFFPV